MNDTYYFFIFVGVITCFKVERIQKIFRLFAKRKKAVIESSTESQMNTLDVNMCCSSFDLPRGYNQALYDKVSNMITLSGNYVRDNQEKAEEFTYE